MSIRVCDLVWRFGPTSQTAVFVLLALADCCNDEGANCFPSEPSIAKKCRITERCVRKTIQTLEEEGWMTVKRVSGTRNEYYIDVERLEDARTAYRTAQKAAPTPERGSSPPRNDVPPTPERGSSPPRNDVPPTPERGSTVPHTPYKEETSLNRHDNRHSTGARDARGRDTPAQWIFNAYPRPIGIEGAIQEIQKALDRIRQGERSLPPMPDPGDAETYLLGRVKAYAESPEGRRDDERFIPHPKAWFADSRYLDANERWNLNGGSNGNRAQQRTNGNLAAAAAVIQRIRDRENADRTGGSQAGNDQRGDAGTLQPGTLLLSH